MCVHGNHFAVFLQSSLSSGYRVLADLRRQGLHTHTRAHKHAYKLVERTWSREESKST